MLWQQKQQILDLLLIDMESDYTRTTLTAEF